MAITKLSVSTVKNGLLKSNKIWDQTSTWVDAPTNSYFPIASYTVPSGGVSSVTFDGIPQTYSYLQVRWLAVTSASASATKFYLNGDTTNANYYNHFLVGTGAAVSAGAQASTPYLPDWTSGGATTAPGVAIIDIFDYTSTNKYKTLRALSGYDANGSGYVALESLLWSSTAAVSSLVLTPYSGTWSQYSNISIYGVN